MSAARSTRRQVLEALATLAATAATWPAIAIGGNSPAPASPSASPAAADAASALDATTLVTAAETLDGAALLDDALGQAFLDGLSATLGHDALARLVALVQSTPATNLDAALKTAGLTQAAETVVGAFYSGLVGAPGKEKMVTYLMALVWGAAPFTKPPSICGGMFGYWANPPAPPPEAGPGGA